MRMQKQSGHLAMQNNWWLDKGEFTSQMSYIMVTKRLACLVQRSAFSMRVNVAEEREKLA